jgi:integrase/recombinase XerD
VPHTLDGLRDAALLSVGYDTLCRSSELVAIQVAHVSPELRSIDVPRSKADPFGDGRLAYLSPGTAARLQAWLQEAGLDTGPLFRGLHTRKIGSAALDTSSVRKRIKVAAQRAGLNQEVVRRLSGHSMRVGAAQDMLVAGVDVLATMQSGGWRSQAVLARYAENASAAHVHFRRWQRLQLAETVRSS